MGKDRPLKSMYVENGLKMANLIMDFRRRFLYVLCFIIFSQSGLDSENNEINAVFQNRGIWECREHEGMRGLAFSSVLCVLPSEHLWSTYCTASF